MSGSAAPARNVGRTLLRLLGPILLIIVIVKIPDRDAVTRAIAGASFAPLALALALNPINVHLKVVRWQVLLATRGIRYPTGRAWLCFLASLYMGMLTPGRVGDVVRAQYLKHEAGAPYAEGIASVVMDRLCDLYVLAAFVAVGVARYSAVVSGKLAIVTWATVALTVLGPLVLFSRGFSETIMTRAYKRLSPGGDAAEMARFFEAIRANAGRPLLVTIPLTVATFLVNYVQGWLIARAIGLPMSFLDATCLVAIASLLGLLPISISGVGVREAFYSVAFPAIGFTAANGVSFGLLLFAIIYLAIVAMGFVGFQIAPPPSGPRLTSGPN